MSYVISSGHGSKVRGASGYLDEVNEARKVVNRVAEMLRSANVQVKTFHDDTSTSQNQNLQTIVNYHNAQSRDLDVSVHFNAYQTTSKPMGTEVLWVTQQTLAGKVSQAISTAGTFINRGAKKRTDLYFLNNTKKPAILLEVCFVDSSTDANLYRTNFEKICKAIAESISGKTISTQPPTQPPVEPPVEPPTQPPVEPPPLTGDNRVDIVGELKGHVNVILNGELIYGQPGCPNVADLTISKQGDVVVTINGEEFHNYEEGPAEEPTIPANQKDITATVFGGSKDPNYSAYPPYDSQGRGPYLNDTDLYVSLPVNISDSAMRERGVRVFNASSELSAVGKIMDKGPWVVDDENYVFGDARPVAETCFKNKTPLPTGPNKGKVPTNDAGIDLSPALASTVGISGKGKVHWVFVEQEGVA